MSELAAFAAIGSGAYQAAMERIKDLEQQLSKEREKSDRAQGVADMMRDEFLRIKALRASSEIDGICDRAIMEIETCVPIVVRAEKTEQALSEARREVKEMRAVVNAAKRAERVLIEAIKELRAALAAYRAESCPAKEDKP